MQMIYYNPKQLIKTKIATFGQETGVASGVWRLRDNWEQHMKCQRDLFCVLKAIGIVVSAVNLLQIKKPSSYAERFSLCAF